jgi:hypothetical protein
MKIGSIGYRLSPRWTLGAGWRHLNIDSDKGEGRDRKLFDVVAMSGALLGVAYSW